MCSRFGLDGFLRQGLGHIYIYIYKYIQKHIYIYRLIKGLQGYRVVSEVFGGEGLGSLRCRAYRVIGLFQRF